MRLTNGGRRIATATGAMLADPDSLGNLAEDAQETLFDPEYWRARGELVTVIGGRGSAWFIASGARQWVLRHFRRGGFIARLSQDGYVWTGEEGVRAFAEWRLLELLARRGLPAQGAWRARNLRRLRRSLAKITRDLPSGRYSDETWGWLMAGYETPD